MFLKLVDMVGSDIQRFAGGLGRTFGKKKEPGTLSRLHRLRMDGIAFISQRQALKSQQGVKPTVKLSAMEFA